MTGTGLRNRAGVFGVFAATRAVMRRLAARRLPLAALGAITAMAAAYVALVISAWAVALPRAAAADLAAMPDAAITATQGSVTQGSVTQQSDPGGSGTLPATVRAAVGSALSGTGTGAFNADVITRSGSLSLRTLPGVAPDSFIKVFSASDLARHAALVAGSWPGPVPAAPGSAVPVAAPQGVLSALHLRVGATLALPDAASGTTIQVHVVGEFRRAGTAAAWWAWDDVGVSGSRPDGPYTLFAPLAVDASAFRTGALHTDSQTWLVVPTAVAARDPAGSAAQATAISAAFSNIASPRYVLGGSLAADLSALDAREAAARAELLAACLLVAIVAAAGLVTASALLAGEGAAQDALNQARGASGRRLAAACWPEVSFLMLAAVAGAFGGEAAAHQWTPAVWPAAALIATAAGAIVCVRAAHPAAPNQLAAARGRQPALARALRDGADLALLALAALALWQAAGSPLLGSGTGALLGVNPVVAAAPALVVAAAAAVTGRLLPALARRAEAGAGAARWLPAVFACWQLSRRPLGYALPALICVAAVGGSTFALAEHASRQRSQIDQGSYDTGAQVRVQTPTPLPLDQITEVTRAHGVRAATPVVRIAQSQGASLLALDSASAPDAVLLRPDLASQDPNSLWRALGDEGRPAAASGGVAVPGRPVDLTLLARLTVTPPELSPARVAATVQDGVGMTYRIDLGPLPADAAQHALTARLAAGSVPSGAHIAYPIRVLRLDLVYDAPVATSARATFSVTALSAHDAGGTSASTPASLTALASWPVTSTWGGSDLHCGDVTVGTSTAPSMPYEEPDFSSPRALPGGGAAVDFYTGVGENWIGQNQCTPIQASLSLTARLAQSVLPVIATRAYLDSTGTKVGATVPVTVNGATLSARIIAVVSGFPTLSATGPGALIADLPALAAAAAAHGGELFPTDEWWLSTAHATVPVGFPADFSVTTAAGAAGLLAGDPLAQAVTTPLVAGAVGLPLLAALCLGASLAAGGRTQQDRVLMLLGADRGQRTAIRCLLNGAVAVPAALLGAALGWLVARLLVPVFVLAPDGLPPSPPVLVVFRPWEGVFAIAALTVIAFAGPLYSALREPRRTPAGEGAQL